jgi:sec-independent protein translocase protein TatC
MPLFLSSVALFYVGVAFAYYVVFPLMFAFLTSTTPDGVLMMTDISSYLDFVLLLFFAFGVAFEVPVAVVLLAATGLVKVESLKKHRGYVLLGIFIVAAILTPPDAVSQSFMAIPMYVLYELGILFAQYLVRQRAADKAQHEAAQPGE